MAVSWSSEADCANVTENARNRMGTDANGLVNTAERVIVPRSWQKTGLRAFESGASEKGAKYVAGTN